MAPSDQADAASLARLARPSFEALYAVARSYLPDALRLLRVPREDVDDLLHDIVLIAHRGLDRYEPRGVGDGGQLDPPRALKAWLSGIAWRVVAKERKRAGRRRDLLLENSVGLPIQPDDKAPSSEEIVLEDQRRAILVRMLERLPDDRADMLIMSGVLEMHTADIAAELGLNENTVKSRTARARTDAIAAVRRLSREDRQALEACPLLVPLGLEASWARGGAPPTLREKALRAARRGAGAAGLLGLGVAIGMGTGSIAQKPLIIAAHEAKPPAQPDVHDPAAGGGSVPGIASSGAPATANATPPARDTLAREHEHITQARKALHGGDYARALTELDAHAREFPHGELSGDRDWLKARVRAAIGRRSVVASE